MHITVLYPLPHIVGMERRMYCPAIFARVSSCPSPMRIRSPKNETQDMMSWVTTRTMRPRWRHAPTSR